MTAPFPQNTPAPRRRSFPKTGEVCPAGDDDFPGADALRETEHAA